ncbi:DUF4097 domain-containing protein [Kangiella sp. TOML190]|uniref:DUF4097 domain-containing protein n=1 Tax=Kangiella sp. TOML190 TaxID=2931351 RepID=UPI002041F710|nr:DUF4097 domain-containing protein [Kangiella sp. TOML190]
MNRLAKTIATAGLLTLSTALWSLDTQRQLSLDVNGLDEFIVDVGAGSLSIEGKPGATQIAVEARITIDGVDKDEAEQWMQDYMDLSLKQVKGKALLCATFSYNKRSDCSTAKKLGSSWFGWNDERKIDLVVTMPQHLSLEVDDGSGSMQLSNLKADVFIDDGSGDIEINNIAGHLQVDDGSGNLEITNIRGNLEVDDGSGNLSITDVEGDLYVEDGSGKLIIDQVTGEAEIEDGSGDIKITNVAKKVYIDDGSGSVHACHLGADLTVDDGSGEVDTCDDIKGKVVIK